MTRVTQKELRETVRVLRVQGFDIDIHWAYGRPRCTNRDQSVNLSPRLSTGEMALWLNGYQRGIAAGEKVGL